VLVGNTNLFAALKRLVGYWNQKLTTRRRAQFYMNNLTACEDFLIGTVRVDPELRVVDGRLFRRRVAFINMKILKRLLRT